MCIANPDAARPAPPIVKATALPSLDLVPRLSCNPRTKHSLVTIVDYLGPKINYHAGIRAGQSDCTEDNFSMGDPQMRARSVTAALDPCSNLVKHGILVIDSEYTKCTRSQYELVQPCRYRLAEPDSHAIWKKLWLSRTSMF